MTSRISIYADNHIPAHLDMRSSRFKTSAFLLNTCSGNPMPSAPGRISRRLATTPLSPTRPQEKRLASWLPRDRDIRHCAICPTLPDDAPPDKQLIFYYTSQMTESGEPILRKAIAIPIASVPRGPQSSSYQPAHAGCAVSIADKTAHSWRRAAHSPLPPAKIPFSSPHARQIPHPDTPFGARRRPCPPLQ